MAGRPPKPTALKLLQGNPGRRPLQDDEPKPPSGEVSVPSWLKGRGRRAWKLIAPVLDQMGLLTTADPHALALLCDAYGEYQELREIIRHEGRVYEMVTKGGAMLMSRPEVGQAADAWRRVKVMLGEFGMTPSARSKVHAAPKEERDEFEEFLSDRRSS